ncbi:MAG: replicative DNA helicase [Acidaminococcaceae bacterium]|nr:replicative DNA helicase [Acidaminococcaceae bacterium]
MQEKLIPQNIAAEQSVLSALLIDKHAINSMAGKLKPEDFYRPSHQIIYQAMLNLHSRNIPVDMVTIIEELKQMGKLEDVGGVKFITLLANIEPTSANLKYHARIVEEKALQREVIESGTALAALGYECGEGELQSVVDTAQQRLLQLTCRHIGPDYVHIKTVVEPVVEHFGEMVENNEAATGLATGFTDLDELIAGLHPSDFIILAARPSMGKTALALNIAENVALRGAKKEEPPKRVIFFSLEMSREQLVQRMICTEANVSKQDLRPRKSDPNTILDPATAEQAMQNKKIGILNRIWTASDKLANSNVYIDDTPGLTIQEMRAKARRMKAEYGIDLIVIDYLQLMQAPSIRGNSENRQREVSEISRGLKAMARELNVPVLALSQLSRSVETRQVKKPLLSDLRESGSLEQDADIVMFLYREDYYKNKDTSPTHLTELIVAKHRNGPTGKIDLFFKNDCTKFISMNEKDAC